MTERLCKWCREPIGAWARRNRLYCDRECLNAWFYENKYKGFYDDRYQRIKKCWERSDNGKRAGIPIRIWKDAFPEEWKPIVQKKGNHG